MSANLVAPIADKKHGFAQSRFLSEAGVDDAEIFERFTTKPGFCVFAAVFLFAQKDRWTAVRHFALKYFILLQLGFYIALMWYPPFPLLELYPLIRFPTPFPPY